ncbi:type II toxin-antitoxin system RelE/ParE family toxin [Chthonobacter albigriseus]|uniref:type II toxin-antitoxin system RelE/ParE family toxin n=1 Tax=Chthonobacter albigriseus TaxID=1683161 RepID=UPI0015EF0645|nr:type II toxin-antitoxin system RelE/ParE family toxin [Chthonobacter albigriseus]
MPWTVLIHDEFEPEAASWPVAAREGLVASMELLAAIGPQLNRPHADTLTGSRFVNMKELRFRTRDGIWRIAFAFDPNRRAVLLVGGDKAGLDQRRFYRRLIAKADHRFAKWLATQGEDG